jgi:hypothetical protein
MKFNLNTRTSRHKTRVEFVQTILNTLINEFCTEYDIYDSHKAYVDLKDYNGNLQMLVNWATSKGWLMSTWELRNSNDNTLYAYGIDFDNECPYFMEARLKYS